jgi:DNA-directed RNA polymerase specialized sigma54-like protein
MSKDGFQAKLIRELRYRYPGCVILKNDANYLQGIPDILILWKDRWAALEVKEDASDNVEANQIYYVNLLNGMSFAAFIYPANRDEVIHDLQRALGAARRTRVSQA